jgi:tyrosine-protein phosphatase SIW14
MPRTLLLLPVLISIALPGVAETPKVRPVDWAQPIVGASLGNFYRVSDELYRAEQPEVSDLRDLKAMGIRSVLSLRHYRSDAKEFEQAGIATIQYKTDAGSVSVANLIAALKLIQSAPKPVLLHCWHGSDRTGFIVAGYRVVIQGWTAAQAVEELRLGGFGFHESTYPNIAKTLMEMDIQAVRNSVFTSPPNKQPGVTEPGQSDRVVPAVAR